MGQVATVAVGRKAKQRGRKSERNFHPPPPLSTEQADEMGYFKELPRMAFDRHHNLPREPGQKASVSAPVLSSGVLTHAHDSASWILHAEVTVNAHTHLLSFTLSHTEPHALGVDTIPVVRTGVPNSDAAGSPDVSLIPVSDDVLYFPHLHGTVLQHRRVGTRGVLPDLQTPFGVPVYDGSSLGGRREGESR